MASGNIDLASLFKQVSKAVAQNQDSLNEADSYNHDHGDHMVEIFEVITQAMKDKKSADPADQLEYAASLLRKKSDSGSATLYAEGLTKAAKQVIGKDLDAGSVINILQSVLGATTETKSGGSGSGDMLGSLLGQLAGSPSESSNSGSGDMLGSLLGQLTGSSSSSSDDSGDGLDMGDLLSAGMNYMAAKQSGKSNLEAITGAILSSSQVASGSNARSQSSEIVASTLLNALSGMLSK
ncbi:MAG: hypothetical protein PWQ55_1025 [Chloroflexota bacterium]|nr:hypothetical protein [Chloroflexota bacterium]